MTILENVINSGNRNWPRDADFRVDSKGKFYEVSDWLGRIWHWLCDFFADRTVARTARVFNEIYSQWGPTRDEYIQTAIGDSPDRKGSQVIQGMKIIQYYVWTKGDPFLEKMKSVDEVFRKNWGLFVALYPTARQDYEDKIVQKLDKDIKRQKEIAKFVDVENLERLEEELKSLRLRASQEMEYMKSLATDMTKDRTKAMAEKIKDLEEKLKSLGALEKKDI